jgi:hypothetical protein
MSVEDRVVVTPRLVVGVCITALGALMLLDRSGVFDSEAILRFWPAGLIALGAVIIAQADNDGRGRMSGFMLVGIGSWLLFSSLGVVRLRFWDFVWPTVLIWIGVNLMAHTRRRWRPSAGDSTGRASLFALMGGATRRWDGSPFSGAELTSFMGGCDLDLRQAQLGPGEEATIDVFAVMGGHEIKVPETWSIVTKAVPIMGGVEDLTRPPQGPNAPRLVIRGFIMMGGVEIKN